jgi:tetratricopeptide (TPR) repeat protein/DNA-binding XRE family transcriptional regulator
MTEPLADVLGPVLRSYREQDLQLSQADLAWLADVSRGTISNLETGKVTPDDRTWHRIRTVLALPTVSPAGIRSRADVKPMIPADAVQGIIEAILNIRRRDVQVGSVVAERWRRLVSVMGHRNGPLEPETASELAWLAGEVAMQAPPFRLAAIHDALRSWGWTTDDQAPIVATATSSKPRDPYQLNSLIDALTSSINRMAAQQQMFRTAAQGFERLPVRVQDLLTRGLVVDWDVDRYDAAPNVAVVDLVLVDEHEAPSDAKNDVHEVIRRWGEILLLARYIFDNLAPDLKPQEIIGALERGLQIPARDEESSLWQRAHRGDPAAMYDLGKLLLQRRQTEDAEHWLRKAAEVGHSSAMLNLGRLVRDRGHVGDAEHWFRLSAEAGHPGARYDLGQLLLATGRTDEAERWLRDAAEAGNPKALYSLGMLVKERGRADEAEQWLLKAAEAGHSGAIALHPMEAMYHDEQKQIGSTS